MKLLFGVESINEIRKVLQGLEVPLTVLKDGAKGAWLMEQDGCIFIPSFKVDYVADEIGAGDAFAAGFLHGYIQANVDKETCVKLGHALAAFVISTEGDTKGLPNKRELERFWNKDLTTIR